MEKVTPATQMLLGRRQTVIEEQGVLAKIKIDDWVLATEDMSPGMNSNPNPYPNPNPKPNPNPDPNQV
jgi:hypothetical protein